MKRDKFSMFNFLNIPEGVTEESVEKKEPDTVPSAAAPPTSKTAPNLSTASPAAPSEVKKLSVPEEKPTKAAPAVEIPKERPPMDLFRAIFDTSDVEDAGENDEPEEPFSMFKPLTDLSSTSRTESDPFSDLLDVNKRARALEKKEFSTKADAPAPVVGPEKPSPAMLATYAALGASMRHQRSDEDSSGEDRHRKKRRKEKSRKSDKVCPLFFRICFQIFSNFFSIFFQIFFQFFSFLILIDLSFPSNAFEFCFILKHFY